MAIYAATRNTPGQAYGLTNSWKTPDAADSPHFPSTGSCADPLSSNTGRNLTERSISAIHLLQNLRRQSFIVLTSLFPVTRASIFVFVPVLRLLPQETGQVIYRGRPVRWGSMPRHACSNNSTCSNSVDMRWMDTLPAVTLGCELGPATRSVTKLVQDLRIV